MFSSRELKSLLVPLVLGGVLGGGCALGHILLASKMYKASARILLTGDEKEPLTNQSGILASRLLIGNLPHRQVEDDLEHLSVTCPDRTSRLLKLDFTAGSRSEAERFLEQLLEAYKKFRSADLMHLQEVVERGQAQYILFRQSHPRLASKPPDAERLLQLERTAGELETRSLRLKAGLSLGQGLRPWALAVVSGELGIGQDALGSDHLRELVRERQKLAELHGTAVSKVLELDKRIAEFRGEGQDLVATLVKVQVALEGCRSECAAKIEEALENVNADAMDSLEDSRMRSELDRSRALCNELLAKMKQAGSDRPVYFQVLDEPKAPRKPCSPRVKFELLSGFLGGGLVGVSLALLWRPDA